MKIIKKAAVSFIVTLILFTAFTIISFSTLFDVIESKFFNKKIISETEQKLDSIADGIDKYINDRYSIIAEVSGEAAIKNSFLVNQSREDIFRRENLLKSLLNSNIEFSFIRVIDQDGKIHYSNNAEDIKSSDEYRITYKMASETTANNYEKVLALSENQTIVFNADPGHNCFTAPVFDNFGIKRGSLFVYLGENDLKKYLATGNFIEKNTVIKYPDLNGIVINLLDNNINILKNINEYWSTEKIANPFHLYIDDSGKGYSVISGKLKNGFAGYILPDESFRINSIYRYILLISAFSIIYILSFLVMNLKQDRITIIAERVKRFQINFLIEYMENKNELEWKKWKKELENRKEEVRKEFKKGIRGIKGEKEKLVNDLIDKSWDEIIGLLSGYLDKKSPEKSVISSTNIQIENIEEIIKRIISSEKSVRIQTEKKQIKTYKDYGEEIISPDEIQKTISEIENSLIPVTDGEDDTDLSKLANFKTKVSNPDAAGKPEQYGKAAEAEVIEDIEALDDDASDLEELEAEPENVNEDEVTGKKTVLRGTAARNDVVDELESVKELIPLERDKYENLEILEEADNDEIPEVKVVEYIKQRKEEDYSRQNYMPDTFYAAVRKHTYEEMSGLAENALLEEINGYNYENINTLSFTDKVETLIKEELLEILSLDDVLSIMRDSDEPVVDRNGILEINQELYNSNDETQNNELRELINKVVDNKIHEPINVSDMFFNDTIDLPIFSDLKEGYTDEKKNDKSVAIIDKYGFDYDQYLINAGDKSVAVMKLLLKISREVGSLFGAILVQDEAAYYPESVVGLDKQVPGLLYIKKKESFYREILAGRKIFFLKTDVSRIEELKDKFSAKDIGRINSIVFFPIKYREKQAYLVAAPDLGQFTLNTFLLKVKNLQK